jgi:hypothetical protein
MPVIILEVGDAVSHPDEALIVAGELRHLDFKDAVEACGSFLTSLRDTFENGSVGGADQHGSPRADMPLLKVRAEAGAFFALRDLKDQLGEPLGRLVATKLVPVEGQVADRAHLVGDGRAGVVEGGQLR